MSYVSALQICCLVSIMFCCCSLATFSSHAHDLLQLVWTLSSAQARQSESAYVYVHVCMQQMTVSVYTSLRTTLHAYTPS